MNTSNLRIALAAMLVASACGGGADVPTTSNNNNTSTNTTVVASVVISPSTVPVLTVGGTTTLTAAAKNSLGSDIFSAVITWSSSDASVASVASGVVTANAAGTAQITAAAGGISATITVTVNAAPVQVPTSEILATLPQTLVNTAAPVAPAAGGQVINVSTSAQFSTALTNAQPGDVIALANGVTFSGNFILPVKAASSTAWIVIRPQDVSKLPPEGSRMTPAIAAAANLPKIVSNSTLGAISTINGSHHYRLVGLEVTSTVDNTGLVRFGDGSASQNALSQVPHDLIADRMYIHGTGTLAARRCVILNSAMSAVVDSHLGPCAELGSDAQAVWGSNGPGPFKIVNNYLEASGENVMFGGADPAIANLVPSDIEIRRNHFYKPTAWVGKYTIKNLFESKNSMRMLVEGNIFENNWQDAQTGSAINIKVANQNGTCTWCTTQDLTFRYNIIRNVGSGFVVSGSDPGVSVHSKRITISDNVVYNINVAPFTGDGRGFYIGLDPTDVTIAHNTIINPDQYAVFMGGPTNQPPVHLSIRDNIIGGGTYGVKSSGIGSGTASITPFMPLTSFASNVIILASATGYPTLNYYPSTLAQIGFVASASGDFHLSSTSPYRAKGTDTRDIGADVDGVLARTSSVIVP